MICADCGSTDCVPRESVETDHVKIIDQFRVPLVGVVELERLLRLRYYVLELELSERAMEWKSATKRDEAPV